MLKCTCIRSGKGEGGKSKEGVDCKLWLKITIFHSITIKQEIIGPFKVV